MTDERVLAKLFAQMADDKARLVARLASRLKYPHLFLIVMALFGADLIIPDAIPFIDEILLGSLTVLFGAWRKRREDKLEAPQEVSALPPPGDDDEL